MKILGIETSCDETSAGVVEDGKQLLSNIVTSSMDLHAVYGGVVPEIAARSHIEAILPVINQALTSACKRCERTDLSHQQSSGKPVKGRTFHAIPCADCWEMIDGIAVTQGAGLGGSLLIGVMTARTLAIIKQKPLYAINHVEAHIYANFITETAGQLASGTPIKPSRTAYHLPRTAPAFPLLGLIVSGGHSQLVFWRNHFDYTLLGQTQDDAIGEAFDKVAKILGLPYPGGPSIAKNALDGNALAFDLPKSKMPSRYDFSFSGIKTAVLRLAQAEIGEDYSFPSHKLSERLSEVQKADIAASFQRVAIETIVDKTVLAYEEFQPKSVVIGGGVAANSELRRQLAERLPIKIEYTDPRLCTDNGAMIATLGCYKALLNQPVADPYFLDIAPNLSM